MNAELELRVSWLLRYEYDIDDATVQNGRYLLLRRGLGLEILNF